LKDGKGSLRRFYFLKNPPFFSNIRKGAAWVWRGLGLAQLGGGAGIHADNSVSEKRSDDTHD
jgi:hypothetical protein